MTIKLPAIVANIFIELNDNGMPMIISLNQLYKVASIMADKKYNVDLTGASILELRLNGEKYFNYIENTNEIVLATNINIEDLKGKFRSDISPEVYKDSNILRVLGIRNIENKEYKRR